MGLVYTHGMYNIKYIIYFIYYYNY